MTYHYRLRFDDGGRGETFIFDSDSDPAYFMNQAATQGFAVIPAGSTLGSGGDPSKMLLIPYNRVVYLRVDPQS